MTRERSNLYVALIIAITLIFAVFMMCFVYYIIEDRNPRTYGGGRNGSYSTISVIGTAEKVFVSDVMEINANFVDNTLRDNFRKYIIAQGISAD